jgi:hypothetical protein
MKNACKSSHKLSHINEKSSGFTVSWNFNSKKVHKSPFSVLEWYVYKWLERVTLTVSRLVVIYVPPGVMLQEKRFLLRIVLVCFIWFPK